MVNLPSMCYIVNMYKEDSGHFENHYDENNRSNSLEEQIKPLTREEQLERTFLQINLAIILYNREHFTNYPVVTREDFDTKKYDANDMNTAMMYWADKRNGNFYSKWFADVEGFLKSESHTDFINKHPRFRNGMSAVTVEDIEYFNKYKDLPQE